MRAIVLLGLSNIFMTLAWYGHLKFASEQTPLWRIILISWGIAFLEYCFQVPANRIGYRIFTATQLKIIQEALSISVFLIFAIVVLGERLRWNYIVAFGCIMVAVYFGIFVKG